MLLDGGGSDSPGALDANVEKLVSFPVEVADLA